MLLNCHLFRNNPIKTNSEKLNGYFSIKMLFLFSYINYSNIAARVLRQALKPQFQADAVKRGESHIKFTPWVDGKAQSKY